MIDRAVDVADWIARQPKSVQDAGEARGAELLREVTLREVQRPRNKVEPAGSTAHITREVKEPLMDYREKVASAGALRGRLMTCGFRNFWTKVAELSEDSKTSHDARLGITGGSSENDGRIRLDRPATGDESRDVFWRMDDVELSLAWPDGSIDRYSPAESLEAFRDLLDYADSYWRRR